MATLTVYPDAGTGATTVDGYVQRLSVDEDFATIRSGAGNNVNPTSSTGQTRLGTSSASTVNKFSDQTRSILTFDTSSIGITNIVTDATLSLLGTVVITGLGDTTHEIVASTPASNNNLVNADYAQLGTTSFGSILWSTLSASAYNDFVLNASGIASISTTGITKLGTRSGWDVSGSFTGTWALNNATLFQFSSADTAGTTSDPKLVVTYLPTPSVIPDYRNFPKPPVYGGR
jgi:uncharacterized protein YjfI (DUF2170 family)